MSASGKDPFRWMVEQQVYQPAPTLTASKPAKLPRLLRAVFWMAVFLFCLAYALGVM